MGPGVRPGVHRSLLESTKNTLAMTLAIWHKTGFCSAPHSSPEQPTHQAHEEVAIDLAIVILDLLLSLSLGKIRCLPLCRLVLKDRSAWIQGP